MNQEQALEIIKKGNNVFITGKPGTGKTYLVELLDDLLKNKKIAITATTGIAATHIGGKTIHSWSGMGILPEYKLVQEEELNKIAAKKYLRKEIKHVDILIIDEISMIHAFQVDAIDQICKLIREDDNPFGGIQVIFIGDFFQLPPVSQNGTKSKYAFESEIWNNMDLKICYLDKIFRQTDESFIDVLNEIRSMSITQKTIDVLNSRLRKSIYNDPNKKAIRLFPTNAQVDFINNQELAKIQSKEYTFHMITTGKDTYLLDTLIKNCLSPKELVLKVGALVMFTKNGFKEGYVNGTQGVVIGFDKETENPIVKTFSGRTVTISPKIWELRKSFVENKNIKDDSVVSIMQIPLKLAYSLTVHKCVSGTTLISTYRGLEYIKDLGKSIRVGTYDVISYKLYSKYKIQKADQVYKGGFKSCISVTTESGFKLVGSYHHLLLIRDIHGNEVWKKMPELKKGDVLILKKGLNAGIKFKQKLLYKQKTKNNHSTKKYKLPKYMSEDLAWILGVLIGNGYIRDSKKEGLVEVTISSSNVLERYTNSIYSLFNRHIKTNNRKGCTQSYFHSVIIRDFLYQLGLEYSTARNKSTPKSILTSNIKYQKLYLQGLFDTDGGVSANRIHFSTSSKKLANEVQALLLNNGIVSSFNNVKESNTVQISITGIDAQKFMKTIKFSDKRKNDRGVLVYGQKRNETPKTQKGNFPDSSKFAKILYNNLLENNGIKYGNKNRLVLPNKKISTLIGNKIKNISKITPIHIEYILQEIPQCFTKSQFNFYKYFTNLVFEKIVRIQKTVTEVYDLHVEKDNSYVGNGIINHNSQGLTLDAAEMDLSHLHDSGMGYVALSRVKDIQGIKLLNYDDSVFTIDKKVYDMDLVFQSLSA